MKWSEAKEKILRYEIEQARRSRRGFMVNFELRQGCGLLGEYFPDCHAGEELFETEEIAWEIARRFADAMQGQAVNVYVIGPGFSPVAGYEKKTIRAYPERSIT